MKKANYRIYNVIDANGIFLPCDKWTVLNAGTSEDSWFTLYEARKIVNLTQKIYECSGIERLWEIL